MLISKKWLSEFVSLPKGVSNIEFAEKITNSTVEVERFINEAQAFANIVVGQIVSVHVHPNADRLKLCQVDVGDHEAKIVCGGTNVREGMKVAVALPGAKVRWHGQGEMVELAKTKVRGEESEGMICASVEVGLEKGNEGEHEILDLGDGDFKPGVSLAQILGRDDVVFEIEHKSLTNRPDLMGHYGIAREVSVLWKTKLGQYDPPALRLGKGVSLCVNVKDADLCLRYMAVAVENVKICQSPEWIKTRLVSCGVRPINNIVDITNFVMLELGQPMHAFDADKIGGDEIEINVRPAKKGEVIACLDEKEYALDQNDLVIADRKHSIAIAGVMGGQASSVGESTTRVVFEAANFSPVSVRKTSQRLALRSESSARFEKSLDPALCDAALRRAVELLVQSCPSAIVCSAVIDKKVSAKKSKSIKLSQEFVNTKLGLPIKMSEIREILTSLGFDVNGTVESFVVEVPSWRATKDVSIAEDVIEEIARVHGYDRIPASLPSFTITPPDKDRVHALIRKAKEILASTFGYSEAYQYAFSSPETIVELGLKLKDHIKLANPLSDERPYLVRSLIPNLFECARRNQKNFETVKLFQCDRVFRFEIEGDMTGETGSKLPGQPHHLAAVFTQKGNEEPFWEVKASVTDMLNTLGFFAKLSQSKKRESWQYDTRSADVVVNGKVVGYIAEADPQLAGAFGLDSRTAAFEIDLDAIAGTPATSTIYKSVPIHPTALRDLAFIVDDRARFVDIELSLQTASSLLSGIELFDVYRGIGVGDGKKSMAVHLSFNASDRTLSSTEVDKEIASIVSVLTSEFGAIIRA